MKGSYRRFLSSWLGADVDAVACGRTARPPRAVGFLCRVVPAHRAIHPPRLAESRLRSRLRQMEMKSELHTLKSRIAKSKSHNN